MDGKCSFPPYYCNLNQYDSFNGISILFLKEKKKKIEEEEEWKILLTQAQITPKLYLQEKYGLQY